MEDFHILKYNSSFPVYERTFSGITDLMEKQKLFQLIAFLFYTHYTIHTKQNNACIHGLYSV